MSKWLDALLSRLACAMFGHEDFVEVVGGQLVNRCVVCKRTVPVER